MFAPVAVAVRGVSFWKLDLGRGAYALKQLGRPFL